MKHLMMASVFLCLSVACTPSDEVVEEQKQVVDSVHQPLDKAKGLEQQVLDNATTQRKQIDDL